MANSSLEFLLDIEARMRGNALSDLERLEAQLKAAQSEYKRLESAAAKAASARAENASKIAQGQQELAKLGSKGVMTRDEAATAGKISAGLEQLVAKEKELAAAAHKANAELAKQGKATKEIADETGAARSAEEHTKKAKAQNEQANNLGKLKGAIGGLPGPLGKAGQKALDFADNFKDMSASMGKGGAVAMTAASAIVMVVLAVYAGIAAMAKFGVMAANAARNTKLTVQALFESKSAGNAVADSFAKITKTTGIGTDRLLEISRSLKAAKVAAADVPTALKAIALQEQALGDQGGTQELIDKLKAGQTTANALASDMQSKFGGVVKQKMLGLDQQWDRFKANIAGLFTGLKLDGFLKALSKIGDLFDDSTSSGKALKKILEGLFQPMLDAVSKNGPKIESFFLGIEEGVLEIMIALKPAVGSLRTFAASLVEGVDIAEVGKDVAVGLAVAIGSVAAAALLAVGIMALPFIVMAIAVKKAIDLVNALSRAMKGEGKLGDTQVQRGIFKMHGGDVALLNNETRRGYGLEQMEENIAGPVKAAGETAGKGGSDAGAQMVEGMVAALGDGEGSLITAARELVLKTNAAARDAAGIKSPSTVWAHYGRMLGAGLETGMDASGPGVAKAGGDLMPLPPDGAPSGGGRALVIENINITIEGGTDDMQALVREGVLQALRQAGAELGVAT